MFDEASLQRLQLAGARCATTIPGWFKGWDLYTAAVRHAREFESPLLVEVGTYLGMSACFMSHSLRSGLLGSTDANYSYYYPRTHICVYRSCIIIFAVRRSAFA